MRLLLSVPDGPRKRELLPDAVLLHGTQRPRAQALRLAVVRVQPQVLQLGVGLPSEAVALQDLIESLEVPSVEGDQRPGAHHRLLPVEQLSGGPGHRGGQRPEEATQALHVSGLLQILADSSHLLRCEQRQRKHG